MRCDVRLERRNVRKSCASAIPDRHLPALYYIEIEKAASRRRRAARCGFRTSGRRPANPVCRLANPVRRPGTSLRPSANPVRVPGTSVRRPANPVHVPGTSVRRSANAVRRPGTSVRRSANAVRRPGTSVRRSANPVHASGTSLSDPANPVRRRADRVNASVNRRTRFFRHRDPTRMCAVRCRRNALLRSKEVKNGASTSCSYVSCPSAFDSLGRAFWRKQAVISDFEPNEFLNLFTTFPGDRYR
jgi:hypothetical protein